LIHISKYNDSYAFIKCDLDQAYNISEVFSFYAENYYWNPKYKAGVWDGKIRLFNTHTGLFPIGLISKLQKYLRINQIEYTIDPDVNEKGIKISTKKLYQFNDNIIKFKYDLYDYQAKAVQIALYKKRAIIESATGSGKSYMAFYIFNLLRHINKDFKFLLIVPTVALVEQMSGDFQEYAENWCEYDQFIHKIYSGKEKTTDKPITISTWQSLQNFPKSHFVDYDCVICDEGHTAKAAEIQNIMTNCINAQFKIAVSGTIQNETVDKMQLEGLFGPIHKVSSSVELQKRGILSKLKIFGIVLRYNEEIRKQCKKMTWREEINFINEQPSKAKVIMKLIKPEHKNNLILFKSIDYGKRLYKAIKKYLPEKRVYYVDGSVKAETREKIRGLAEKYDNVVIVASYGTFSTGVNIKNLHNIIFAESSKSMIKILQSIGRVLRLHETKDYATLYDICDDLSWKSRKNYVLRDFFQRIEIYEKENFKYSIKEILLK